MIKTSNTQSLTDFRANAAKTLERLNKTGHAEIITVNGKAEGVLIPPAVYDEFVQELDIASSVIRMRKALHDVEQGEFQDGFESLKKLRDRFDS